MTHTLGVESEVGQLRQSTVHRPDPQPIRLTQRSCDELLVDDVLWADRARAEPDIFTRVPHDRVVAVHHFAGLLMQILDLPEAKAFVLDQVCSVHRVGPTLTASLRTLADDVGTSRRAEPTAATGPGATKLLHCLPALRNTGSDLGRRPHRQFTPHGAEVSNDVFEPAASIVPDQAENRLHTIEAVMVGALGTGG